MDLRGEVVEQKGHPVMDAGIADDVVVIKYQIELARQRAELVDHGGEDAFGRWLARFQDLEDALPDRGHGGRPERGEH